LNAEPFTEVSDRRQKGDDVSPFEDKLFIWLYSCALRVIVRLWLTDLHRRSSSCVVKMTRFSE
jgi:hypothetical protein